MNLASVLTWIGRLLFFLLFYAFLFRMYRALLGSVLPPRASEMAPASAAVDRSVGGEGWIVLEECASSGVVWLEERTGEERKLVRGAEVPVKERLRVGRSPANDLRIADPFVSSEHLALFRDGDAYFIEDLGTTNGTQVDQRPVRGVSPLRSGAVIEVGSARFRFEVM